MTSGYQICFEGNYVEVRSDGDKDFSRASRLWADIAEACRRNGCYRVLGIANSTTPVSTLEGYDHAALFQELGVNDAYRIAWVELNPETVETYRFVETVLVNRGLPGRLFSDVDAARRWLLEESDR